MSLFLNQNFVVLQLYFICSVSLLNKEAYLGLIAHNMSFTCLLSRYIRCKIEVNVIHVEE